MGTFIGKPHMLKEINSSMIEQLLYKHGSLSKPKLAKMTKLSLTTVNKIVCDLEKEGRVCPVGLTGQGAGRRAWLYQINKDAGCIIALYYLWGKYVCRIADIAGNTLFEELLPLDNSTVESAASTTIAAIDDMFEKAPSSVKAIGIGVPGAVMFDGRLCGIPKIDVWEGFCLTELLTKNYDVDVYVENDVKLSAVGYYHKYLCDKFDNIVYIYAGNGLGSGIILNKKLFSGSTNFSGEFGFMAPLTGMPPQHDYTTKGGYLEKQLHPFISINRKNAPPETESENRSTLANILAGVAANYVAIINPDGIVFAGEAFDAELTEEIRSIMSSYSPERSLPQILYDDSDSTGVEGLVLTCVNNISTQVQLVQNGGV